MTELLAWHFIPMDGKLASYWQEKSKRMWLRGEISDAELAAARDAAWAAARDTAEAAAWYTARYAAWAAAWDAARDTAGHAAWYTASDPTPDAKLLEYKQLLDTMTLEHFGL